ncbi:MAG: hypothetical protein Kow0037_19300 [Calditrichia bacterium]
MRTQINFILIVLFFVHYSHSTNINSKVFRIGGMELPPFGFGYMLTQPHSPIDSTNTDFKNYYVKISLWIGGITSSGDTLVSCADYTGLNMAAKFILDDVHPDTSNILQLPNYDHSILSCYQDTAKGWYVKQYNLSIDDYSYGVIVYEIEYSGKFGVLNQVYSGVKFDFDVPDSSNWPTSRDDKLDIETDGFTIRDFFSNEGMEVTTLLPNTLLNYWNRENSPRNLSHIYQQLSAIRTNTTQDTADYHFLLSRGPFIQNNGEIIILAYMIHPYYQGLYKANISLSNIKHGIKNYTKNKNLAAVDKNHLKDKKDTNLPKNYYLFHNFPNPFNPVTEIKFSIPEPDKVTLEIYNILGQRIKKLINKIPYDAGNHSITWDATNEFGQTVSSGVYFYRLTTEKFRGQKKMLFIQ